MQPGRDVADVVLEDRQGGWVGPDLDAGRLGDERRCSAIEIPVVIGEVVECRLGDGPAHESAVRCAFIGESDDEVEVAAGRGTAALRNHGCEWQV